MAPVSRNATSVAAPSAEIGRSGALSLSRSLTRRRQHPMCRLPLRAWPKRHLIRPFLAVVVLLRVIAIDLVACLTDLLHDKKLRLALQDSFDLGFFVSWDHDEPVALAHDRLVPARWNLDRFNAGRAAALAVEGQPARYGVLLGALLDPPIDIAEDLLVASGSFSEVHRRV